LKEGREKLAQAAPERAAAASAGPFEDYTAADVRDLIQAYPLAWVCDRAGSADSASLLPLIGEYDEAGSLICLVGHCARSNPLFRSLRADRRALILFTGPQAYVSPADVGDRAWAPTWNYAQVRVEADIAFDPPCTEDALAVLVDAMESGREAPWHARELGARYDEMVQRIIGFRAQVSKVRGRFKLGQDEQGPVLNRMVDNAADPSMKEWLTKFGRRRADRDD